MPGCSITRMFHLQHNEAWASPCDGWNDISTINPFIRKAASRKDLCGLILTIEQYKDLPGHLLAMGGISTPLTLHSKTAPKGISVVYILTIKNSPVLENWHNAEPWSCGKSAKSDRKTTVSLETHCDFFFADDMVLHLSNVLHEVSKGLLWLGLGSLRFRPR